MTDSFDSDQAAMVTKSDMQALRGAVGELAQAVKDLADAVKEGPFSDSDTRRVAVSVSKTVRNITSRFAGEELTRVDQDPAEQGDPARVGAVAIPEDVVALARAGKTLEAVKRYRVVSGASLAEAQTVIRDIN
jgi:ribosomal protein L7/L12